MRLDNSKVYVLLVTSLIILAIPLSVQSATFQIKPVVLTGDPAPEGGIIFEIPRDFSMNNAGTIAS